MNSVQNSYAVEIIKSAYQQQQLALKLIQSAIVEEPVKAASPDSGVYTNDTSSAQSDSLIDIRV